MTALDFNLVWVATIRAGIPYHRTDPDHIGRTRCGRSTHHGAFILTSRATEDLASEACPRCWPTTAAEGGARRMGRPTPGRSAPAPSQPPRPRRQPRAGR